MPQCPCCNAHVEVGAPDCPDCGLALGGLDDHDEANITEAADMDCKWPDGDDGMPEPAVSVVSAKGTAEYALIQALLRGCGIPSFARFPQESQFSSALFGGSALGAEIYVPESRLAEARTLLDNGG